MNISDRILDRLGKKTANIGYRTDISVTDMRTHTNTTASMLLTFNPAIGDVTGDQLSDYFINRFSGKIAPVIATAKHYPKYNAISVVAELVTKKRPFEDKEKMMAVGSACFIDTNLNETYEVKSTTEGTKYLAKLMADDIHSIVTERNKRMAVVASKNISFDDVDAVTGVAIIDVGDKVKIYDGSKLTEGEITRVADRRVSVKTKSGESVTTDKGAIVEIICKAPTAIKEDQKMQLEYYTKMYGDEKFAKQLLGLK